jgi:ABC-type Na+ efflux pump permease subunit
VRNILTISRRELTRLRSRFTGRSRLIVLVIGILAAVAGFAVYQQDLVFAKNFYTIGVSADGPIISDKRFNVFDLEPRAGLKMLYEDKIDVYVYGNEVINRSSERSQYATAALKQYLEREELYRISEEYDLDRAFPLRVEVRELPVSSPSLGSESPTTLADLLGSAGDPSAFEAVSQGGSSSESGPMAPALPESGEPASGSDASGNLQPGDAPGVGSATESSSTSEAVRDQLESRDNSSVLPEFKAEFVSDEDIIIPSLMDPPTPLAQVILAFLYVVPLFFVSVFFTSSFMEEKTNRKLLVLLSAPVTPFQIIMGKMLPYLGYAIICIVAITLFLHGSVLLSLGIFIPVMLFIMAIYLMVALLYRTFKDQTFFSVLAVWIITAYLVAPAMFSGVSDLSYISPLALAVQMYRGESFSFTQYLLSTTPMYMVFIIAVFVGTRIFNEEYLMGFRPLHTKIADAISLAINRDHLNISIFLLALCVIPVVFMVQLASIVMASNLPMPFALWALFALSIIVEEIAKSTGILVLLRSKLVRSRKSIVTLSFLSALGFLIGEKLLLYLALSVVSESLFTDAVFSAGLLVAPLFMHFVATAVVCLLTHRLGTKFYPLAIVAGSVLHTVYNLSVIGVIL